MKKIIEKVTLVYMILLIGLSPVIMLAMYLFEKYEKGIAFFAILSGLLCYIILFKED